MALNLYASEDLIMKVCKSIDGSNCNAAVAVAWVESNFRNTINKNDGGSPSYGMMQVKCIAARQAGFKKNCKLLKNEKIALRFGILFLEQKLKKYKSMEEVFASYNSNVPIRCIKYKVDKCYPRELVNHNYVYKAMRRYKYQIYKNVKLSMLGIN
jgi:hypothetical protein